MTESERIKFYIACETDGEISPAQLEPQLPADQIEVVERLAASDIVLKMRRVQTLMRDWPETTRSMYAKRFGELSLQFCAAAALLRRHRIDDDVPQWLRSNGAM